MKIVLRLLIVFLLGAGMMTGTGCIFDSIDLKLNIPLTVPVDISGPDATISQVETFDLDSSSVYLENKGKIEEIKFMEAVFRAKSSDPENLSGKIVVKLETAAGFPLFTYDEFPRMAVSDYIGKPIKLELSAAQIKAIDDYIKVSGNTAFKAEVEVREITPDDGKVHTVIGALDLLISTVIKAD